MKPSIILTLVIAIICFDCNNNDDDSGMTPPVRFTSISDVTSNSATFTLAITGPIVQQNDTSFFFNGENIEKVGFAYTNDLSLHFSKWDTVFTKPIIAPLVSVKATNLQGKTRYRVRAVAWFREPNPPRAQQYLHSMSGEETLEFQTN